MWNNFSRNVLAIHGVTLLSIEKIRFKEILIK